MKLPKWLGSRHEVWVWHQDWMLVLAFVLGSVWGHVGHGLPWSHIGEGAVGGAFISLFAQFVLRAKRIADVPRNTVSYALVPVETAGPSNN